MGQEIDTNTAAQDSLANGNSISTTVDTDGHANEVIALVDDNGGSDPSSYDITFDVTAPDGTSMQVSQTTGSTARSHTESAVPDSMTVTVTNQSGAGANFRVVVVAYRQ